MSEKIVENTVERNWCNKVNSILLEMRERKITLTNELKELEHKQQECLHFLELEKCSASLRAKTTKLLVDCRRKRRSVKEELADLDAALSKINKPNCDVKTTTKRSYTYSETFIKEIYGEGE